MTSTPAAPGLATVAERLRVSALPVERELAALLSAATPSAAQCDRLQRFRRKVDVAPRVVGAYDDDLRAPLSDQTIGDDGHFALAWLFLRAADRAAAGPRLRWLNAAFKALDRMVGPEHAAARTELLNALDAAVVRQLPAP